MCSSTGELFVHDLLDLSGLGATLVLLHHDADDAAGGLGVDIAQLGDRLPDRGAQLVVGQTLGQELGAVLDL